MDLKYFLNESNKFDKKMGLNFRGLYFLIVFIGILVTELVSIFITKWIYRILFAEIIKESIEVDITKSVVDVAVISIVFFLVSTVLVRLVIHLFYRLKIRHEINKFEDEEIKSVIRESKVNEEKLNQIFKYQIGKNIVESDEPVDIYDLKMIRKTLNEEIKYKRKRMYSNKLETFFKSSNIILILIISHLVTSVIAVFLESIGIKDNISIPLRGIIFFMLIIIYFHFASYYQYSKNDESNRDIRIIESIEYASIQVYENSLVKVFSEFLKMKNGEFEALPIPTDKLNYFENTKYEYNPKTRELRIVVDSSFFDGYVEKLYGTNFNFETFDKFENLDYIYNSGKKMILLKFKRV